jgi:hypothetical protein
MCAGNSLERIQSVASTQIAKMGEDVFAVEIDLGKPAARLRGPLEKQKLFRW